uniref:Uncharacterized protein n=1 Tax=Aegilops tauschii TaxID=37682 RepID=N1QVE7_AEGTA
MAREMNGYFSHPPPPPPVPAPYQEEAAADVDDAEDGSGGQGKLCSRGHWRPAEDARLKELVGQYGPQNWNLIAEKLDGRSGKSCRLRWFNQLDPRINRRAFTEEEEDRLMAAHRAYGNKPPTPPPSRAYSGGESDESASTCTTDLSLSSGSAAVPCFYHHQGYDMAPQAHAVTQAFSPSARSAFSAPSSSSARQQQRRQQQHEEQDGDKLSLPFFDFLGVGST